MQILKAQRTEDLTSQLQELRDYSEKLEQCMQKLVDVYFTGFNRSIKSYSDVLNCVGAAQGAVRRQMDDLQTLGKLIKPDARVDNISKTWY